MTFWYWIGLLGEAGVIVEGKVELPLTHDLRYYGLLGRWLPRGGSPMANYTISQREVEFPVSRQSACGRRTFPETLGTPWLMPIGTAPTRRCFPTFPPCALGR